MIVTICDSINIYLKIRDQKAQEKQINLVSIYKHINKKTIIIVCVIQHLYNSGCIVNH